MYPYVFNLLLACIFMTFQGGSSKWLRSSASKARIRRFNHDAQSIEQVHLPELTELGEKFQPASKRGSDKYISASKFWDCSY